jgi:hypothetical protein
MNHRKVTPALLISGTIRSRGPDRTGGYLPPGFQVP